MAGPDRRSPRCAAPSGPALPALRRGRCWWPARGGRLAGARRRGRLRGAAGRRAGGRGHRRPRAAGRLGASGPRRTADAAAQLGLDPVERASGSRSARDGGPEAAARTARYAALGRRPREHGRPGRARAHPRRPGRDGAARAGPRLGAALGGRHGRAGRGAVLVRPLLGVRRATTRAACAAQELPVGRPAQHRPRVHPGAGARRGAAGAGGRARRRGRARARPHRRPAARGPRRPRRPGRRRRSTALADDGGLSAAAVAGLPAALRRRVLRAGCARAGVPDLQAAHLGAVDALLTGWRGQGRVDLPGGAGSSGRLEGWCCAGGTGRDPHARPRGARR